MITITVILITITIVLVLEAIVGALETLSVKSVSPQPAGESDACE